MSLSNLTSSIRGKTGNEKITNIGEVRTSNIVAANASISGVGVGTAIRVDRFHTKTASLSFVAPLAGNSQAIITVASLDGTLTNNVNLYGKALYVDASIANNGKNFGTYGDYAEVKIKGGNSTYANGSFSYLWHTGNGTNNYGYGHEAWVEQDGEGTISNAYGHYSYVAWYSGQMTNGHGFYADVDGSINNAYGYYADMGDATASKYGFYADGETDNYMSGNHKIGGNLSVGAGTGYMNLNGSLGSAGYGFRDNNGVIQWRDSGGAWMNLASLVN